jgi:hypothetical protein
VLVLRFVWMLFWDWGVLMFWFSGNEGEASNVDDGMCCFLLSIGLRKTWDKLLSRRMMFFLNGLIIILGVWSSCRFFELISCPFSSKVIFFPAYLHGFLVQIWICLECHVIGNIYLLETLWKKGKENLCFSLGCLLKGVWQCNQSVCLKFENFLVA